MLFGRNSKPEPDPGQPAVPTVIAVETKPSVPSTNQPVADGSITIDQMLKLQEQNQPVYVLDVRSERSYESSDLHAKGAIRMHPDDAVRRVKELNLDKNAWLIAFCA